MNAAGLFALHVVTGLSRCAVSFQLVEQVLQAREVSDASDPALRANAQRLKRFLWAQGARERDDFLIRSGLLGPGLLRRVDPPLSVLKATRGGFSKEHLEQAAGLVYMLRDILSFGYEFFPGLSRDTATALQELSARAAQTPAADDQWVDSHAALSPTEAEHLAVRAVKCLHSAEEKVRDVGISVLRALADCRQEGFGVVSHSLLVRGVFSPPSLYRAAPDQVAGALVRQILAADRLDLNPLLLALAWTRGKIAQHAFLGWKTPSLDWNSELYVPPEHYLAAGWTLDTQGDRRELICLSCHRLLKNPQSNEPSLAVGCRVPAEGDCPRCAGALSWLFDFSALPRQFFSGAREGAPRKLLCCLNCACFGPVFSRYSADGSAQWLPATVCAAATGPPQTRPPYKCQLSPVEFPPFAAANAFEVEDATTLGGIPMWLQNFEYPRCPQCGELMPFLAQFDNMAMTEDEEGIYYAFFCRPCQVAAVSYQQP